MISVRLSMRQVYSWIFHVIIIISATMFSGSKIRPNNENLHLVLAVLQLSEYFCRPSTKSLYSIMSRLFVLVWAYNVLWTFTHVKFCILCNDIQRLRFVRCVINGVSPSPKRRGTAGSTNLWLVNSQARQLVDWIILKLKTLVGEF